MSNAMMRSRARSTLFPYTTLFRSAGGAGRILRPREGGVAVIADVRGRWILDSRGNPTVEVDVRLESGVDLHGRVRSEEHTSELQSRENLVCRLLLEKKKNDAYQ